MLCTRFYLLPILPWLLSCLFNGAKAQQVEISRDTFKRISYQSIDLTCFDIKEGTYIIQNGDQLRDLLTKRKWNPECKALALPDIDFEYYTLLGFVRGSSGCYESKLRMAIKKNEVQKKIQLSARINYTGDCMMYTYYIRWCLVQKIPDDFTVSFALF